MEAQDTRDHLNSKTRKEITFHYIKSSFFRVIHCNGFFGGVTPNLEIHMSPYNERNPIPQSSVQEVKPDGTLGDEIRERRVARDGMVREIEVDIYMNLGVAKSLRTWLDGKITELEKILESKEKGATK
jgi:hypothetical protein